MRKLFTILLLTLTYNCYSQINDTLAFIPASPPAINHKITYDLTGYATKQNLSDTGKVMRTLINAATTTANTTQSAVLNVQSSLNTLSSTVANHGLTLTTHTSQISGLLNQVATTQVNVAQNTADIIVLQQQGTGGGGSIPSPRTITTSTYTIVQSDTSATLLFSNKCTISISSSLKTPFKCSVIQTGATNAGQVIFTGSNINSGTNWKRVKFQYGKVDITATSIGIININGDLKL